jgi:hypothetical protein
VCLLGILAIQQLFEFVDFMLISGMRIGGPDLIGDKGLLRELDGRGW